MRDTSVPSGWQAGPNDDSEEKGRKAAQRGRRKGARSVRKTIQLALAGGPKGLLAALNLAVPAAAAPEMFVSVSVPNLPRAIGAGRVKWWR